MSEGLGYQARIRAWLIECFGIEKADDKMERVWRFTEEALELGQSLGMTQADAMALVSYVYGRPVGEPGQELGGTMVTLAALCSAPDVNLNMFMEGEVEFSRICQPEVMNKIRRKQLAKSEAGLATALPGSFTDLLQPEPVDDDVRRANDARALRHHCIVIRLHNSDRDVMKFTPEDGSDYWVFSMDKGEDTIYLKAGPFETRALAREAIIKDSYYEGMEYLIGKGSVK